MNKKKFMQELKRFQKQDLKNIELFFDQNKTFDRIHVMALIQQINKFCEYSQSMRPELYGKTKNDWRIERSYFQFDKDDFLFNHRIIRENEYFDDVERFFICKYKKDSSPNDIKKLAEESKEKMRSIIMEFADDAYRKYSCSADGILLYYLSFVSDVNHWKVYLNLGINKVFASEEFIETFDRKNPFVTPQVMTNYKKDVTFAANKGIGNKSTNLCKMICSYSPNDYAIELGMFAKNVTKAIESFCETVFYNTKHGKHIELLYNFKFVENKGKIEAYLKLWINGD